MGYSHFWYRPIEILPDIFQAIQADVKTLDTATKGKIGVKNEEPVIFVDRNYPFPRIVPEDWQKIFMKMLDGRIFQFAKTNHGSLDRPLQCLLIIAKHHLGDTLIVTSDGYSHEWQMARDMVQEGLGYGADFTLDESPTFEEMGMTVTWHPTTSDVDSDWNEGSTEKVIELVRKRSEEINENE